MYLFLETITAKCYQFRTSSFGGSFVNSSIFLIIIFQLYSNVTQLGNSQVLPVLIKLLYHLLQTFFKPVGLNYECYKRELERRDKALRATENFPCDLYELDLLLCLIRPSNR